MWYVYVLTNEKNNFLYVGSTKNLKRRLTEHNKALVKSTKPYLPLDLNAYISVKTEKKARELEKYLKTGSGKAVLKRRILSGNF